jgi:hypothetical protein
VLLRNARENKTSSISWPTAMLYQWLASASRRNSLGAGDYSLPEGLIDLHVLRLSSLHLSPQEYTFENILVCCSQQESGIPSVQGSLFLTAYAPRAREGAQNAPCGTGRHHSIRLNAARWLFTSSSCYRCTGPAAMANHCEGPEWLQMCTVPLRAP